MKEKSKIMKVRRKKAERELIDTSEKGRLLTALDNLEVIIYFLNHANLEIIKIKAECSEF